MTQAPETLTYVKETDEMMTKMGLWLYATAIVTMSVVSSAVMWHDYQQMDDPSPGFDAPRIEQRGTKLDGPAPKPVLDGPAPALVHASAQGVAGLDGSQPVVGDQVPDHFGRLAADIQAWADDATGHDLTQAENLGPFARTTGHMNGWAAKGKAWQDVGLMRGAEHPSPTPSARLRAGEQVIDARTVDLTVETKPSSHWAAAPGEHTVDVTLTMWLTTNQGRTIESTSGLWFSVIADPSVTKGYRYLGGAGGTSGAVI